MKAPLSIALMITGLASYPASLAAQARFVYANNDLFPGNNVSAFSVDEFFSLAEKQGIGRPGRSPACRECP